MSNDTLCSLPPRRYVFSDGMADDQSLCLDFLEARIRHGQTVPVIHTVGFFPEGSPENFEGRRYLQALSIMTGGTHQQYERNGQVGGRVGPALLLGAVLRLPGRLSLG